MHNLPATTILKLVKRWTQKEAKSMPHWVTIVDYNKWIEEGGVDLADQLLSYYSMTTRPTLVTEGVWKLIDITINSWIIFHTNMLSNCS